MYNKNEIKTEISGRSLEFFANAKNRDDRFCLTPTASLLRRHSEPQAKNPEKNTFKDWNPRFAFVPFKMTISTLAIVFSLNLSTSYAAVTCAFKEGTTELVISGDGQVTYSCGYKSATSVTFAEGSNITSIGVNAFCDASKLTSITIPEGVTSIGQNAFLRASSLTSITIPDSVTSIGVRAFCGTSSLKSITLPDSLTSIGSSAFEGATGLESITIPDSVTSIGSNAFDFTGSLTNIMCKGDATSCAAMVNALPSNLKNKVSYPTDKTSCEGTDISMYVWDGSKCGRRNATQCNSVAKYYYNSTSNQCRVLPKKQSACTGSDIEWDTNNSKCINKNAITAPAGDPVTPVEETPQQVTAASCAADGKVLQGKECVSSCGASFRLNDGECDRIRYTPAEAAAVLHDDNTNIVTITFKK